MKLRRITLREWEKGEIGIFSQIEIFSENFEKLTLEMRKFDCK